MSEFTRVIWWGFDLFFLAFASAGDLDNLVLVNRILMEMDITIPNRYRCPDSVEVIWTL